MPIQVVTTVEFEDEWIINFRVGPNLAVEAKEEEQEQAEKVTPVDL